MSSTNKTISLVLGSGGARGLAHIGIIRVLQRHGWRINAISGSSIGALIGGFFAAGKLDAYADWVQDLTELNSAGEYWAEQALADFLEGPGN